MLYSIIHQGHLQCFKKYFASGAYKVLTGGQGQSHLTIEWTSQHGCGGDEDTDPHKVNCNIVLQYMCHDEPGTAQGDDNSIRNGQNTNRQQHTATNDLNEDEATAAARKANDVDNTEGQQETWEWYDKCYNRERNKGLFTADQKLTADNGNGYSSAIYTRQNANGNRRGYECSEEKDYYPYWHPTPWKDMAILVSSKNINYCSYYQSQSYNVMQRYECVELYSSGNRKHWSRYNNEVDCLTNGGQWLAFTNYLEKAPEFDNEQDCLAHTSSDGVDHVWGRPEGGLTEECLVALDPPDCQEAPWSRVNHHGNTRGGQPSRYEWILPYFPSGAVQRCAIRARYNISTDDYDPMYTDSNQNNNPDQGVYSPVTTNPFYNVGAERTALRLAVNTAQFGRTFQDRSHAALIMPRPTGTETSKIYNLNVRGKRGNIVQTYPGVEYDFIPNNLEINAEDLVHIQWAGSNTHNNGDPGGDGQTGDAGEGTGGTDRHNIAQTIEQKDNYPMPYEVTTMWAGAEVLWSYFQPNSPAMNPIDLAVNVASSGYYQCIQDTTCGAESVETKAQMNNQLNNVPASYSGVLVKFTVGQYNYICTRNNSFSNRSQKGRLVVN